MRAGRRFAARRSSPPPGRPGMGGEGRSAPFARARKSPRLWNLPFGAGVAHNCADFPGSNVNESMLESLIVRAVGFCSHHYLRVILIALLVAAGSGVYTARNFAVDTNINDLLSAKLPWRQQEIACRKAFPQTVDLILVDVEASTPEAAEGAARALEQALALKSDL